MKEKISVKDLREIITGCEVLKTNNLSVILDRLDADYYLTRVEGWRCDVYLLGDIVLIDGYDTIDYLRGKTIPYYICKKYNDLYRQNKKDIDYKYNESLAVDLIKKIALEI